MLKAKNDGKTHINIYSKGATVLGQQLSNFYHSRFVHPVYGEFTSVEGFWYWLKTGKTDDKLRVLSGFNAKQYGKKLERVETKGFNNHIKIAIQSKVLYNGKIRDMLMESTLPFEHYYYFGEIGNEKIVELPQYYWIVEYYEQLRKTLRC